MERLKAAWDVSADADLASKLHATRQTVSKWRSRGSVPYASAVFTSIVRGVSLDYLLTGAIPAPTEALSKVEPLDPKLLRSILLTLYAMDQFTIDDVNPAKKLEQIADAISFQYGRAQMIIEKLKLKGGLTELDAREAARLGTELLGSDGTFFDPTSGPGRDIDDAER